MVIIIIITKNTRRNTVGNKSLILKHDLNVSRRIFTAHSHRDDNEYLSYFTFRESLSSLDQRKFGHNKGFMRMAEKYRTQIKEAFCVDGVSNQKRIKQQSRLLSIKLFKTCSFGP